MKMHELACLFIGHIGFADSVGTPNSFHTSNSFGRPTIKYVGAEVFNSISEELMLSDWWVIHNQSRRMMMKTLQEYSDSD
jgi:hypothetical protein